MATQYEPVNLTDHAGMVTVEEPNRIADANCVLTVNEDLTTKGSFGPRKGSQRLGNQNTGNGKILSETTMKLRAGTEIQVRTRQDDDNTKSVVEWYNSRLNVWEMIIDSLTQRLRMVFIPWNTSSEDRLYMCNGTDTWRKWKGIVSYVVSNTATTLDVSDATDFPNSGTVWVNSVSYAYTGKVGNQLTGLTALPAFTVDQGVTVAPETIAGMNSFKSNKAIGYAGRLWVAIGTGLFYTKSGNPEDFTYSTPRVVGDGGVEDFPEGGGNITGLAVRDEVLIIMKQDILRTFQFDRSDVLNEFPVTKPLGYSPNIGPASFHSVAGYLKEVYYVSKKGGLRQLTAVIAATNATTQTSFDVVDLFDDILNSLTDVDFTDAATVVFEDNILVACKETSSSTGNDIVLYKNRKTGAIGIIRGWNVNTWTIREGKLFFGSSVEPNSFQAFIGWTDNGGPISSRRITKRYDFGEPARKKEMSLIYIDGYIGDGTIIKVKVRLNEKGKRSIIERNIRYNGSYVSSGISNTLGEEQLGINPLGGTLAEVDDLNFFRVYLTVPIKYHYNYDLDITSEVPGARYKICTIAPNPKLQKQPDAKLKLSS